MTREGAGATLAARTGKALLLCAGLGLSTGCASAGGGLSAEPSAYGSSSARAAVAAFLEAARERDYTAMGRLFGTRDGPAEQRLGVAEVEQRMIVLAGLLEHEEADLRRQDLAQLGPGHARFVAALGGTRQGRVDLPVVAASTPDGRWFVERIDVNALGRSDGRGARRRRG